MAIAELHFNATRSLQKMTSATVIVPEGRPGPFPVWYLLHGLSDNHTAWTRRTNLERYAANFPVIIVMPNGERGFYTDAPNPPHLYESHIVRDTVEFIDVTFNTIADREHRVISGLSMGGYGALKLALKNPDKFGACVSHSGAVTFGHGSLADSDLPEDRKWLAEFRPLFGDNPRGGDNDIFTLAQKIERAKLPQIRIDCGTEDFLINENRELHAYLEHIGVPHEYQEFPGAHTWEYWDEHVQGTIKFFAKYLKVDL
ncbi:MAG: putative tributyrin esterase [Abditibacteriota bacterium]|nr:putative tributyrin esterase [Abditibacteriota bacterium]